MKSIDEVVVALRRLVAEGASRRDLAATVTMDGLGFSGCYTNGMGMPMLEDMHPGLKPMAAAGGGRAAGSRRGLALTDESGEGAAVTMTAQERARIVALGLDPDRIAAMPETANFHDWQAARRRQGGAA